MMTLLVANNNFLKLHDKALEDITVKVNALLESKDNALRPSDSADVSEILATMPIKDIDTLENVEDKLKNETIYNNFVSSVYYMFQH